MSADSWGKRALCGNEGPASDWDDDIDGVDEKPAQRRARHARAKKVCARCPVQLECAEFADWEKDSGIWFGVHLEAWRASRSHPQPPSFQILDDERTA